MIAKVKAGLWQFFFKPGTGEVLSVLRIVVGLMIFIKGLFLYPHLDELYGQFGYLQSPLMGAVSGGNLASLSVNMGMSSDVYSMLLHAFFVVHLLSALTFMAGWKTRGSNFVLWLTQTMLFQLAWVSAYGIDSYLENLCFILLWLPAGQYWSVDAKLNSSVDRTASWVCTLGLRCLQIYLLMTYVDAGISKASGTDWWTGQAIWEVLHLPEFNHMNFFWMADFPIVPRLLGWGTLVIETFYIVGVWIPVVGLLWTISIVGMHLFIASMMGLTLFGITLALINVVLFLYPNRKLLRGAL
jgi:hypothetical protein